MPSQSTVNLCAQNRKELPLGHPEFYGSTGIHITLRGKDVRRAALHRTVEQQSEQRTSFWLDGGTGMSYFHFDAKERILIG